MSHAEEKLQLVEEKIKELRAKLLTLKKKRRREGLSCDEEVELEEFDEELKDLKTKEERWLRMIEKGIYDVYDRKC